MERLSDFNNVSLSFMFDDQLLDAKTNFIMRKRPLADKNRLDRKIYRMWYEVSRDTAKNSYFFKNKL